MREDERREVLGIFNKPTESALGWGEMLTELQERGVRKIGLVCADGLKGLEDVISAVFPGTPLQRCTTHLKRNLLSSVRNGDKGELAEDLRQVFRTGDRSYTVERAWEQWQTLCEKWGQDYRSFRRRGEDPAYKAYFTYLNYEARIQSMIYTTNWIERLQKDFLLMGKTAMDKKSYLRLVPKTNFSSVFARFFSYTHIDINQNTNNLLV